MNFVDTAITLLQESGKPMAAEEICKMALDRGLLDKPGANPVRSMKTRLTVELKKGGESRVQKTDDEAWLLCKTDAPKAAKKKAAAKSKSAAKAPAKGSAKPAAKAKAKAKVPAKKADKDTAKKADKDTAKTKSPAKTRAKPAPRAASEKAEPRAAAKKRRTSKKDSEALSSEAEVQEIVEPPVVLTAEEQALVDLYSDDSSGTRSAAELNEYSDELTQDEDRLMLPEIKAERKPFRRDRDKDRPRQRRSRRGREGRDGREVREARDARPSASAETRNGTSSRPVSARTSGHRDISGEPISVISAPGIARERVTRSALQVLSTLPGGQSMPVRQLTQTMISRELLDGSADQLWRMVKGTLLVSEQRRLTRGLKPLVRYHGKDLFSATPEAGRSIVNVASMALQKAAENYAAAVEVETLERLAKLAPAMLERVAYVYLQTTGWSDIQWIKRVENSSYALATEPGAVEQSMISVRSGPSEVDRRGVGELRAGLHAKGISSGLLLSPCEMSEEAEEELAKDGTPLRIICGSNLAAELLAREVGVTWRHIQLPQIDQRFYDAVLS